MPMTPVSRTPGSNAKRCARSRRLPRLPALENATQIRVRRRPATGIPELSRAAGTRQISPADHSSDRPARCSTAPWSRPASTARTSTSPTRSSISIRTARQVCLYQKPSASVTMRRVGPNSCPDAKARECQRFVDDLRRSDRNGFVESGLFATRWHVHKPHRGVAMHNHSRRYSSQGFDISLHNL